MLMITADRFLAVKLALKYAVVMTRRKMIIIFPIGWVISLAHGCFIWFFPATITKMMIGWNCLMIVIFTITYTYIFVVVVKRSKHINTRRHLNLKVPISIVIGFICFYLIPGILVQLGVTQYSAWLLVVFLLNTLSDSIIYILSTRYMKSRMCCHIKNSVQNMRSTGENELTELER